MSHSPEPWEILASSKPNNFDLSIHDANGKFLSGPYDGLEDEDMIRVVACVNFCRSIPTEQLQQLAKYGPWSVKPGPGTEVLLAAEEFLKQCKEESGVTTTGEKPEPKWGRCMECGEATHLNDDYLCSTCEDRATTTGT